MILPSPSEPSVCKEDREAFLLVLPHIVCVLHSIDPVSAKLQGRRYPYPPLYMGKMR